MNPYGNSTKPALDQLSDVLQFIFLPERPRSKRCRYVSLGPRDPKNGRGPEDPRSVGSPEPSWRWAVGTSNKVSGARTEKLLLPHQFAIA